MTAMSATRPMRDRIATHILFLGNGLVFGTWAANLPRIKEAKALSDANLGVLLFLVSVGAVAAMPGTGILAARWGAARLSAMAGLCAGVAICLPSLIPTGPVLLASAALMGVMLGSMDVAMNAHASAVEIAWGKPIMSSFHAFWSLGGLAGSGLAGLCAALGLALVPSYIVPGVIVAACSVPALFLARLSPRGGGARLALPGRLVLGVSLMTGLCFAVEGGAAEWTGVYLRIDLHTGEDVAATAFGAFSLAMAAGRLTGDAVVRRFGAMQVAVVGCLVAAVGQGLVLLASGPLLVSAGMALIGAGMANVVPVAFSAAGRLQGPQGVAAAATTGYAGLLVAPPLLGGVAEYFGLPAALAVVLASLLVLAAMSATLRGLKPAN